MPLPITGPLPFSQINSEGIAGGFNSTNSLRQLSNNAGFSIPDNVSEFYGYDSRPITGGLVAWLDASRPLSYPGSGTTWTDLSGSNNTGTLVNGPTFSPANGGSIVIDGVDDYVNIPNSNSITSNVVTVSLFFRYVTVNNYYGNLISLATAAGGFSGWNIYIYQNRIYAQIKATEGAGVRDLTGPILTVGNWYNVTLRSVSSGTSSFLINNVNYQSTSTMSYTVTTDQPLRIARATDTFWTNFGGNIGSLFIYSRSLSDAELTTNYNRFKGRFGL